MKKAFLNIENEIVKRYLIESNIFELKDDISNSDLIISDSVDSFNQLNDTSNKDNIYIASNNIEYLYNVEKYCNFNYYIGFGKPIYEFLKEELDFDVSLVLDGFVYSESFENKFKDKQYDILLISNNKNLEDQLFESKCVYNILEIVYTAKKYFNIELKIGTNSRKIDLKSRLKEVFQFGNFSELEEKMLEIYSNEVEFLGFDIPLKYMNQAKCVIFFDLMDARIHYNKYNNKTLRIDTFISYINNVKMNRDIGFENSWPKNIFRDIEIDKGLKDFRLYIQTIDNNKYKNYILFNKYFYKRHYKNLLNEDIISRIDQKLLSLINMIKNYKKIDGLNIKNANDELKKALLKI